MTAGWGTAEPREDSLTVFLEKSVEKERRKKSRHRLCLDLAVTAAAVLVLFRIVCGIAVVQGDSMEPSLTNGNTVFFYRLETAYQRNSIVIFMPPGQKGLLIKRVVAVAGDRVDIDDKTGTFLVNGVSRQEEAANGRTYQRSGGIAFPFTVPKGCVFVLGDNRETALDSRSFGAVGINSLVGKVFFEARILNHGT